MKSSIYASLHIMSTVISLAKASHMARLMSVGQRNVLHPLQLEVLQSHMAKGVDGV